MPQTADTNHTMSPASAAPSPTTTTTSLTGSSRFLSLFPFDMSVDFNRSAIDRTFNGGETLGRFDLPFFSDVCGGGGGGQLHGSGNRSSSSSLHLSPFNVFDDLSTVADDDTIIYTKLRFVLDVYVVVALCVVGFVGNALAFAVLRRDQVQRNTSFVIKSQQN